MSEYLTPPRLRSEDFTVLQAIKTVAETEGKTLEDAICIYQILPASIQNAPAFRDKLTGLLRYEYGLPYHIGRRPNRTVVVGTNVAHQVSILLNGLLVMRRLLTEQQVRHFCKNLGDKSRHLDYLSELDPILRPTTEFKADYEGKGFGRGKRKIDWHIAFDGRTSCLLDVKHRLKGLIDYMQQVSTEFHTEKAKKEFDAPLPDGLFANSEAKFRPVLDERWQGIWILTQVYYDDHALHQAFDSLDPQKIQFVVLTHFRGEARLLTKLDRIRPWLMEKFNLTEMKKR